MAIKKAKARLSGDGATQTRGTNERPALSLFMVTMSAIDLEALEYIRTANFHTMGIQALRQALALQAAPGARQGMKARLLAELKGLAVRARKPKQELSPADTGRKCVYRFDKADRLRLEDIRDAAGLSHWTEALRFAVLAQAAQDGWELVA